MYFSFESSGLRVQNCLFLYMDNGTDKSTSDFNEVEIFYKNNKRDKLKYKPKSEISDELVDKIINHLN